MRTWKRVNGVVRTGVAIAVAVVTLATCEQGLEPTIVDVESVEWVEYVSEALGVRLEHPARWRVEESGNTIRFAGEVATAMRVTLVSAEEARDRGLWGRRVRGGGKHLTGGGEWDSLVVCAKAGIDRAESNLLRANARVVKRGAARERSGAEAVVDPGMARDGDTYRTRTSTRRLRVAG
jgi:hypothetical protein